MYYGPRILGGLALAGLTLAAFFSIRLALASAAFRRGSPESAARAVALLPKNAEYLSLRALQLEYDGENVERLLERIAALNPLSSAPRIRLGLAAEARGDVSAAERWLLDAARVDRQFEPRWTLANFYFRQGRSAEFWKWMRAALEVSYGDRAPAFDLCWRVSQNPQEILVRAIPQQAEILGSYLSFLLNQHREGAGPVALRLAALRDPAYTSLLEVACDALLDAGDAAQARELWRLLGYGPAAGIANGDFTRAPRGHGFDWRWPETPGVAHVSLDHPAGHRLVLSGRQPESCDLLRQMAALEKGKRYELRWETRAQGISDPSGIEWSAAGQHAAVAVTNQWRNGALPFTAPADLAPVTLSYRRPIGQARAEGAIEIRNVSLAEVGQ